MLVDAVVVRSDHVNLDRHSSPFVILRPQPKNLPSLDAVNHRGRSLARALGMAGCRGWPVPCHSRCGRLMRSAGVRVPALGVFRVPGLGGAVRLRGMRGDVLAHDHVLLGFLLADWQR